MSVVGRNIQPPTKSVRMAHRGSVSAKTAKPNGMIPNITMGMIDSMRDAHAKQVKGA